jgi:hypothetical protein
MFAVCHLKIKIFTHRVNWFLEWGHNQDKIITSRESLTLDFGKLRPGAYLLQVAVSTVQDSSITASIAKSFVLVEEKR